MVKKPAVSKTKEKAQRRAEERQKAIEAQFEKHYLGEWGNERWPGLLQALKNPVRHCIMLNKFAIQSNERLATLDLVRLPWLTIPCFATTQSSFPPPARDGTDLMLSNYYILDAGSVLATEALQIQPDDRVLDLCAAPGGKTLSILQRLGGDLGSLTVNELSADRRRRLRKVLDSYIPPRVLENVTVLGRDGMRFFDEPEMYDKVLLDAPCSSERHVLHDPKELELWTPKKTTSNAKRQYALLKAALHSVRVDGLVLYATCSISSVENDKVVEKMMRKGNVPFVVIKQSWPVGEHTKLGWIMLPDKTDGWGPLYFSLLKRTGISKKGQDEEEEDSEEETIQE